MRNATISERVFSGVQPTGNLHLGNYLGAIKNFVNLQRDYECVYCVVDMHAITQRQKPEILKDSIREVAAAFIASGIDPSKHIVFNQSQVAEHAELAWIFNCVSPMGWLSRMTQFKEKAGKNKEKASVGLFSYPNLMAADILLYRATHVPVGEDQKQHLELTRNIAQKFNNDYAPEIKEHGLDCPVDQSDESARGYFPITEPLIGGQAARVMNLRDGTQKMSKSDPSDLSRINLGDDADSIAKKFRKAKTDSAPVPAAPEELENRPEADNLLSIFAALADMDKAQVMKEFGGREFSAFKPALADLAIEKIAPIGDGIKRLLEDRNGIDDILAQGADKARTIAAQTMIDVKNIIGFVSAKNSPSGRS